MQAHKNIGILLLLTCNFVQSQVLFGDDIEPNIEFENENEDVNIQNILGIDTKEVDIQTRFSL